MTWSAVLITALTQVQLNTWPEAISYLWLILLIQFLYMGLFITVHDACHGSVAPDQPRINLWVGRIFSVLYAGFSFDRLKLKHHQHHQFSGTFQDPDFHPENQPSFFPWLINFFKQYVSLWQILLMSLFAQILFHVFHLPEINVFTFWVLPSVLSSLQLFYFGTYLPHKKNQNQDFQDHHRTRNKSLPKAWSFLSCYHFGAFHHNHHRSPGTPWYQLPGRIKTL